MKRMITFLLLSLFFVCRLEAEVIDSFDSTAGFGFGAGGSAKITKFEAEQSGLKVTYDLSKGDYVYISKNYAGTDLSKGDSIRIRYKGTGGNHNLELKLTDTDGDKWWVTKTGVTNTNNQWVNLIIKFSELIKWEVTTQSLAYNDIAEISFAIAKNSAESSSGSFEIDKIELYQSASPTNLAVNTCNNATNALGNAVGTWTNFSDTSVIGYNVTSSTPSPANDGYYEIAYNMLTSTGLIVLDNSLISAGVRMDVSGADYLTFYARGEEGGEKFYIEMWWWDDSKNDYQVYSVPIINYIIVSESWQLASIPLTAFNGLIKSEAANIKIVFNGSDATGRNKLYIDELRFSNSSTPDATVRPVLDIDEMNENISTISTWASNQDSNVTSDIDTLQEGSTVYMKINYSFAGGGNWLSITRNAGKNISFSKGLRFSYKGTGNRNNLEFKLTDMAGVIYWRKFFDITNTGDEWKSVTIPLKEFTPFDSSKTILDTLNLKGIKSYAFAIVKNLGGSGTFSIDNLELVEDADYSINSDTYKIIKMFEVPNNPISPNGDNIADTALFKYVLKEPSTVTLEIFNLKGELIRSIEDGYRGALTQYTIEWNAQDESHMRIANGLYLYRFSVKGSSGNNDEVKHVIGVIR